LLATLTTKVYGKIENRKTLISKKKIFEIKENEKNKKMFGG
jgi:hypothetical protein